MKRLSAAIGTTVCAAFFSVAALAGDMVPGVWSVKDTKGNDFNITLSEDGKASAERAGEGLSGTWKKEGDAVVISWQSGWTTKIKKSGEGYMKAAYDKGTALDGDPTHTSDAKKVK